MAEQELNFIINAINKSDAAFKDVEKNIAGVQGKLENMKPAFQKMAVAGTVAFGAIAALGGIAIKSAANIETQRLGFETLLGSAKKADEAIKMIQRDAASTPFEFAGLIEANKALTLVTKDAVKSEEVLLNVGKALSAAGKGQPELDRIILNLQQIGNTGKITEMDIRQFGMNGINILELLADYYGVTKEKAGEMVKDSKNAFDDLSGAFEKAGAAGGIFAEGFSKQADSMNQLFSNLKDTIDITATQIGNSLLPIMKRITESIIPIIDAIGKWAEKHPALVAGIIGVGLAVSALVAGLGFLGLASIAITAGLASMKAAFVLLKVGIAGATKAMLAFMANPVVLILGAIAIAVYLVYKKMQEMADMFGGWGNAFRLVVMGMKIQFLEFADSLIGAVNQIFGVWGDRLNNIRASLNETRVAFDKLAVEGYAKAQEGAKKLDEGLDAGTKNMVANLNNVGSAVKDINKEIADANKQYKELMAQDEKSFQDEVVGIVYNAKVEYERLAQEKNDALAQGRRDEVSDIESKMGQQMGIIQEYHNLQLNLGKQLSEYSLYMGKSELGRAVEDYNKKRALREEEHKKALAEITERNTAVKESGKAEIKVIDEVKNAFIAAEQAKTQAALSRMSASSGGGFTYGKSTPVYNVKDAVITPQGQVIKTDPADWLFATKNPMQLAGAGNNISVNINGGYYLSENVAEDIGDKIIDKIKQIMKI